MAHLPPITVLVVEDEVLVRWAAVEALTLAGFMVLEASNGHLAASIIEGRPDIEIVFTDIEMPGGMSGLELADLINKRWPSKKILITSGGVTPCHQTLARSARFLSKPYDFDRVIREIHSLARDIEM